MFRMTDTQTWVELTTSIMGLNRTICRLSSSRQHIKATILSNYKIKLRALTFIRSPTKMVQDQKALLWTALATQEAHQTRSSWQSHKPGTNLRDQAQPEGLQPRLVHKDLAFETQLEYPHHKITLLSWTSQTPTFTRAMIPDLEASGTPGRSDLTVKLKELKISDINRYLVLRWTKWGHKHILRWQLQSTKATCTAKTKVWVAEEVESLDRVWVLSPFNLLCTIALVESHQRLINLNKK